MIKMNEIKQIDDRLGRGLLIAFIAMLAFYSQSVEAQNVPQTPSYLTEGWYIGMQGGIPFGVSTFTSFGADKTRAGYNAGLFGGYRFNPLLSAELSMKWGKIALAAHGSDAENSTWLGADGNKYPVPVAGIDGWAYAGLKSTVALQQYGAQLNVNILGFFEQTRQSRWKLEISPLLALVGTKATIKTLADNAAVLQGGTRWHLGAGGNLQAGYAVTEHLSIGVYSGIIYLTGRRMDGIPKHLYKNNFLWESGIRLGWSLGKQRKTAATLISPLTDTSAMAEPAHEAVPEEITIAAQPPHKAVPQDTTVAVQSPHKFVLEEEETPKQPQQPQTKQHQTKQHQPAVVEQNPERVTVHPTDSLALPSIYFAFNSARIASGETAKLQTICRTLQQNPNVCITLTGWCDTRGSRTVNERISRRRADALKAWLVANGIPATRIQVQGMGSDYNEPDAAKARRVELLENKQEPVENKQEKENRL